MWTQEGVTEKDRRERDVQKENGGKERWRWVERGRKRQQHSHTHTATMGEEDNTLPVGALISKMAAKHLTRVLFLSALSSAISSSLSRSCSRQTFSSLVNTANSCGAHVKTRSGLRKQTFWKKKKIIMKNICSFNSHGASERLFFRTGSRQ